jgi:hypothetical protein
MRSGSGPRLSGSLELTGIEKRGPLMWCGAGRGRTRAHAPSTLYRLLVTGALTCLLAVVLSANALAAGKTVSIGTPFSSGPPSVAVDSSGNALVAWANTKDLAGALNFVQYCVLPVGASACSHSGNLQPADSAQYIDGVHVLSDGGTLVVLADVFGAAGDNGADYEPVQEWQSTDGGATFSIVNGGLSVTDGVLNADTGPLSAVIVPGTGVLGFGWDTAASSPPTFNAFPLSSPPECSKATCPAGFAALEPNSNPDQIGNPFGEFAAQAGAAPGVMGVFDTLFTNGPLGCAKSFGTAYAYGAGNQSASNSYNISPGSPNSAWKVPVAQLDCNVENPAVAGGPSGFGVLETDEGTSTAIYHRFNASTMKFDTPMVTVAKSSESNPALSQDGGGNVYATYLLDGSGGPINLSYSADGGKSFATGTLDANTAGGADMVTSAVNGGGQGWATWLDNGSVFAKPFQASDAISPVQVGGGATDNGATITLNVSCVSFPCTVTITLTAPETVIVHAASVAAARKGKRRTKTITLGNGRFTIKSAGAKKLAVKLSRPGKRFLASKRGHLKISGLISETVQHHTLKTKRSLRLTIHHPKKHRK